uniref:Uncharacterized protein n=1 Tax=Aegilops tauschii TaxID=37682 RepID=M8ARW1_AEGTA
MADADGEMLAEYGAMDAIEPLPQESVWETMGSTEVYNRGPAVRGFDPLFDPFCIWGNELSMNINQIKKLRKIVRIKKLVTKNNKMFVCIMKKTSIHYKMPDPPPRPAPRPTHPNRRESSLAERHGLGDALAHLHGPRGREGRRRRRRRQLRQGDHRLGTAPTLLAFPRQGLRQGKPLSLEAHGPGGDRPKKPRRYGVMEMRSPCYSFRPAHHALQVIVVKAAMGRRGGFGTRQCQELCEPSWKGLWLDL